MKSQNQKTLLSLPPYKITSEEVIIDESSGKIFPHYTLHHPGAVVVIPFDGKYFYLVEQFRFSIKQSLKEFPAGKLEKGEDPLESAKRELAEEAGKGAREWQSLGAIFPAPGFCNEIQHLFLATDLCEVTATPDEDEVITTLRMTKEELNDYLLNSKETVDAKTIASFFRCLKYL